MHAGPTQLPVGPGPLQSNVVGGRTGPLPPGAAPDRNWNRPADPEAWTPKQRTAPPLPRSVLLRSPRPGTSGRQEVTALAGCGPHPPSEHTGPHGSRAGAPALHQGPARPGSVIPI